MIQQKEIVRLTGNAILSAAQVKAYFESGFLLLKNLFTGEEVEKLKDYASADIDPSQIMIKGDLSGNKTKLRMWNSAQDDLYGMFSRNARLVDNTEAILGEEIYTYSSKMILKNAREGGAWE